MKEKQGIGFTTQRRRHPRNRFPRSIHDQAKKKYILRCFYPLYSMRTTRETALYADWDVKLRVILNDDFRCFRITRKVNTTCSRNARAGS